MTTRAATDEELALDPDLALAVFGGKGGVGKTTCAAAAALSLADRHEDGSVLLFSTDPAHSLRDIIGDLPPDEPDNFQCREFDSASALDAFRERHRQELETIVRRGTFFDEDEIRQLVDLALPGMDEVMALLELADLVRSDDDTTIVLDTAPTGHTMRLLELPDAFERWIEFLDLSLEKHRYMKARFGGSAECDASDAFLDRLRDDVEAIRSLLTDPERCQFTIVARAETMSLAETERLADELDDERIANRDLLINRIWTSDECDHCRQVSSGHHRQLQRVCEQFEDRRLWWAPDRAEPPRGPRALIAFGGCIQSLESPPEVDRDRGSEVESSAPGVEGTITLPALERDGEAPTSLLFAAGKGGVGKTTMASALATRVAERDDIGDVLVFSTDPAHSLGDCFDEAIGSEPTSLGPGLAAAHLDAEARFEALQSQYRREIASLFEQISDGAFDLTYDRPVVERLMEMAPPGIDEVMGLVAAMEWAGERAFDVIVFDTAPTGHFLRLLEMPDLFDDWLKMFFRIKLEHKRYLKLPELSEKLVTLSKQLKQLRVLMANEATANMVGIVTPSTPALEECQTLTSRANATDLAVPALIVNRMTPRVTCTHCEPRRERQLARLDEATNQWNATNIARVHRGAAPRGREMLSQLGGALLGSDVSPRGSS